MPSNPTDRPTRAELARELLRYKMEEYSQDGFCASWLDGLEWDIWEASELPESEIKDNFLRQIAPECRELGEIADGWWTWIDDTADNPIFIPLDQWRERAKVRPSRFLE